MVDEGKRKYVIRHGEGVIMQKRTGEAGARIVYFRNNGQRSRFAAALRDQGLAVHYPSLRPVRGVKPGEMAIVVEEVRPVGPNILCFAEKGLELFVCGGIWQLGYYLQD
jgi:hypothetical protein